MILPRFERQSWAALTVAAVAAVLAFGETYGAIVPAPLPTPVDAEGVAVATAGPGHAQGAAATELVAALRNDVFHPERRPPTVRFRLPGEGTAPVTTPATAALRLIGVALVSDGKSFALVQVGSDSPRLVRIGESAGGYTLKQVMMDRASFAGPDGKVQDYRVPKAGT